MRDWKRTRVFPQTPIREAMKIIDESSMQIALVVDDEANTLIGVVSDGDIRRGLLRGVLLDQPVSLIMNKSFTFVDTYASKEEVLKLMTQKEVRHIPVLDSFGHVVDLKILNNLIQVTERKNWIIIMAGGLGQRLRPLTDDCPKPLLKIGDKPILQIILDNFIEYGFKKFFISVNYKGEMIKDWFGDGSRWGIEINYLHEDQSMGTAGALGFLKERPCLPLIVMNSDLLTSINFEYLLDFHNTQKAKATMCVRDYHFQVPYGVVETDQLKIKRIDEKPIQRFFVNAGIYVLEPEVLELIPKNRYLDMTTLFELIIGKGYETATFPIREYWMDIGHLDDYQQAIGDYKKVFK
jgi:dTDP-glucose pyrophosphorylase/predicted transcriptional regulator